MLHRHRELLRVGSLGLLITNPAFVVMKAADEFKDKTPSPHQLWKTDFVYRPLRERLDALHQVTLPTR